MGKISLPRIPLYIGSISLQTLLLLKSIVLHVSKTWGKIHFLLGGHKLSGSLENERICRWAMKSTVDKWTIRLEKKRSFKSIRMIPEPIQIWPNSGTCRYCVYEFSTTCQLSKVVLTQKTLSFCPSSHSTFRLIFFYETKECMCKQCVIYLFGLETNQLQ